LFLAGGFVGNDFECLAAKRLDELDVFIATCSQHGLADQRSSAKAKQPCTKDSAEVTH
jgi:hypothetical protein